MALGGRVTGGCQLSWPLSCPPSVKRSSVATVTALAMRKTRSSTRSGRIPPTEGLQEGATGGVGPEEPGRVDTITLEDKVPLVLEGINVVSEDMLYPLAAEGDRRQVLRSFYALARNGRHSADGSGS